MPIYLEIAQEIQDRITRGIYLPGQAIPSEAEICDAWEVSRNTARAAARYLAREGVVHTVPGRGSFVAKPEPEQD